MGKRRTRHFADLTNKKHGNKHLQNAWNLYGGDSFVFMVVAFVDGVEALYTAEDKWLRLYVGKKYCYNIGKTAAAPTRGVYGPKHPRWGQKHTTTSIAQIKTALVGAKGFWYGKKRPEHSIKVAKPVRAIGPCGTTTYTSITNLCKALDITYATVCRVLKSGKILRRGKHKGWFFMRA